ncbi:hypothetical protein EQM14_00945 [Caproiciproducens sp. NJN-50]|uniref:DUF5640 domain-containing protein n=1 Tax=Acutalibacteraceae TaxID=3082771 RepID=UPI000FFE295E|nr:MULTISPECIES: DUF5640 domain-containing protein [Acutalibacteraceae]QAT48460.1 hypothetical protein EQM14_00945 [Caproiciproducens sp. NJN-50]
MKKILPVLLAAFLLLCTGCKTASKPEPDRIAGVWKDSYGLTEYRFNQNGTMKIEALNFGSFKGTYSIQGSQITMQYKIVVKNVKETYDYRIDGDTLYLDDQAFKRKK